MVLYRHVITFNFTRLFFFFFQNTNVQHLLEKITNTFEVYVKFLLASFYASLDETSN